MCLREELVGIADEFLLDSLWLEVVMWQREVLRHDVIERQSGSGVSLAHTCIAFGQTFGAQHFGSAHAVSYIRFGAMALDTGCVDTYYSYVVQHGCVANKVGVDV